MMASLAAQAASEDTEGNMVASLAAQAASEDTEAHMLASAVMDTAILPWVMDTVILPWDTLDSAALEQHQLQQHQAQRQRNKRFGRTLNRLSLSGERYTHNINNSSRWLSRTKQPRMLYIIGITIKNHDL